MHDKETIRSITLMILLLCLFPLFQLSSQNRRDELVEQELSWGDVEAAWGYEVIIRSGSEEVLRQQTKESVLTFSLNPGEYEFSIVVLNKFKKVVGETPWKPLIIKEAFQPVVRRFTPDKVFEAAGGSLAIQAEVYQAKPDTHFFLTGESGEEIEGRQSELKEESVTLVFPMNKLPPGIYTLSAVDSSGLEDTSEINVLTVLEVIEPEVRSVSNRRLEQKEVYPDIIVKGKQFEEGFTAKVFMDDQLIVPYETEWISEEEVRLALITGEVTPGRYDLEIINPSGVVAKKERAFIIEKAPLKEIIHEVPPSDSLSILGGYTFASGSSSEYGDFSSAPYGFGLKFRQDMSNKVFWRVPGLRPLGIELGMDFTSLFYENADFYYNQFYTGLHAYYKVPLSAGLDPAAPFRRGDYKP